MPKILYESKKFAGDTLTAIRTANRILEEYAAQGFDLTLRQLFYQHVARGLIPNTERSYKRLGSIVNDARMAGLIDWNHIIDRTRNVRALTHWNDPAHIIRATARSFQVDMWEHQDNYVEVWIEKDALIGVIQGVCDEWDVPYFSCRGYTSQSEMWGASRRLLEQVLAGKRVTILHLGDHDPSGIDMTRDIDDRLKRFVAMDYVRRRGEEDAITFDGTQESREYIDAKYQEALGFFEVNRIALTIDQIDQYNPPPNPAKSNDSRYDSYIERYGDQSWELDALEPTVLADLIRTHIEELVDGDQWDEDRAREEEGQELLRRTSVQWAAITKMLQGDTDPDTNDPEEDE